MNTNDHLILVVDDSETNINVVTLVLRQHRFVVIGALNGRSAIQLAEKRLPSVILLDIMMPEMDGIEVCKILKGNPATAHIPVIFLTANTDYSMLAQSFQAGAIDYITKPFNDLELIARVKTQVELAESRRAILQSNQKLEEAVKARTAELEEARAQIARALEEEIIFNETKSKFITMISHEFRTPLTAILGNIDIIERTVRPSETLNEQRFTRAINRIRSSSRTLTTILDSISQWNNFQTILLNDKIVPTKVPTLIQTIVSNHRDLFPEYTFELIINLQQDEIPLYSILLTKAINQLLDNAIKFSDRGTKITVEVIQHNNELTVNISDQGKGIIEEDKEIIFQLFRRGKDEEAVGTQRGLGIGLAMVKLVANHLNGTINVQSGGTSQGSTFSFTFPITSINNSIS